MRTLPAGDDEFATRRVQPLRMFDELFVQSVSCNGRNHVAPEQTRHRDRFRRFRGCIVCELDRQTRKHGGTVLHTNFGERSRSRVCRERAQDVNATSGFGTMMPEHVLRAAPQQKPE
jgi:hypothetical protein